MNLALFKSDAVIWTAVMVTLGTVLDVVICLHYVTGYGFLELFRWQEYGIMDRWSGFAPVLLFNTAAFRSREQENIPEHSRESLLFRMLCACSVSLIPLILLFAVHLMGFGFSLGQDMGGGAIELGVVFLACGGTGLATNLMVGLTIQPGRKSRFRFACRIVMVFMLLGILAVNYVNVIISGSHLKLPHTGIAFLVTILITAGFIVLETEGKPPERLS